MIKLFQRQPTTVRIRVGRPILRNGRKAEIQHLYRETLRGDKVVRREILDSEEIPQHVLISLGCFGDTGGWQHKWAAMGPEQLEALAA